MRIPHIAHRRSTNGAEPAEDVRMRCKVQSESSVPACPLHATHTDFDVRTTGRLEVRQVSRPYALRPHPLIVSCENELPIAHIAPLSELAADFAEVRDLLEAELLVQSHTGIVRD